MSYIKVTYPIGNSFIRSTFEDNSTYIKTSVNSTFIKVAYDGGSSGLDAERLRTKVYNVTGATLVKGTVVYINGSHGNLPSIAKAIATSDATSAQTLGLVMDDITDNKSGYIILAGKLSDLNTNAFANGSQLYLSSTVAGTYTTTKQYAPAHLVYVGIVNRSHPTQGEIEVKIQNGYEADEIHDFAVRNPSNNDGIFFNTSTSLWEKKSIATALGYTPANAATTLTINGVTFDISSNRSWTIAAGISGSGSNGQVSYWTGASSLGGSNNFFWDATNGRLGIGTNVPTSRLSLLNTTANEYILTLRASGAPNPSFNIEDGDITIPNYSSVGFNPVLTSNTVAFVGSSGAAIGGLSFSSFSNSSDERALGFSGYSGKTTATTFAVVSFRAAKHDGGTNATTLSSTDIAFQFNNWTSPLIRVMGSGNFILNSTTDDGVNKLQVTGSAKFTSDILVNGINIGLGAGNVGSNLRFGGSALLSNTTGAGNVALGYAAMYYNTGGSNNMAIGVQALVGNSTGDNNVAVGTAALFQNFNGYNNVAIGHWAAYDSVGSLSNTVGANNIFIGYGCVGESGIESNRTWIGNASTTSTWLGGNLLLGTRTNGTQRLQVLGSASIVGEINMVGAGPDGDGSNRRIVGGRVSQQASIELFNASTGQVHIYPWNSTGVNISGSLAVSGNITFSGSIALSNNQVVSGNGGAFYKPYDGSSGQTIIAAPTSSEAFSRIRLQTGTVSTDRVVVFGNGNVSIGTTSDLSARLGISGTTLSTTGFEFGVGMFLRATASNHATMRFGTNGSNLLGAYGTGIENSIFLFSYPSSNTTSAGDNSLWGLVHTFNPTSGSSGYIMMGLRPTINQVGATGITRGLYVNPTLTAAFDFRAIETTAGNVLFGTNFFWDNAQGRLGLGTNAPTVRLQVSGDTLLRGSGATSATTALTVQNSASTNLFTVRNDGVTSVNILSATGSITTSSSLSAFTLTTSNTITALTGSLGGVTSGTLNAFLFSNSSFSPSSGNASINGFTFTPTINQTGTANGITRGLYVNPTLTSAFDFRAIETTNGKIIFGNLPTSSAGLPTGTLWNDAGTLKVA